MTVAFVPMPSDVAFSRFLVRMACQPIERLLREAPGSHITAAEIEAAHAEARANSRSRRWPDIQQSAERMVESVRIAAFTASQIEIAERLLGLTEEDR